jgi:hypothetical protein
MFTPIESSMTKPVKNTFLCLKAGQVEEVAALSFDDLAFDTVLAH